MVDSALNLLLAQQENPLVPDYRIDLFTRSNEITAIKCNNCTAIQYDDSLKIYCDWNVPSALLYTSDGHQAEHCLTQDCR